MRRPEQVRRAPSPVEYDSRIYPGSEAASPAPFNVGRRFSVSAVRMASRSPPEPPHARLTLAVHPTARERKLSGPGYPRRRWRIQGHMGGIGIGKSSGGAHLDPATSGLMAHPPPTKHDQAYQSPLANYARPPLDDP
ncbi:uncharacterized protein B0H18DRAFT_1122611 [Fomitopsis serialis]|uniref:uncharacterized protein n=1 Tax=Fomitopsis serialis TaxID=139415 RepID=UPI002007FB84|nr:uncharacterized protein B0H18DRAFT_1122611 [Neoantrodia serialis]KAH9919248.1 hypothetical protein B0H18DRAFT_1122611 [Neoantrodia serialis]